MKDRILQTLRDLRAYALSKGIEAVFFYHEEDSYLMRFANSAISLNTNEHLVRLDITAYADHKRANFRLITNLGKLDEMKQGVDTAAEMAKHAQPLKYLPTIPSFANSFEDASGFDPDLAQISNEKRLSFFNQAGAGLETDEIQLSGIFSNGTNIIAQANTRSEHTQFFKTSDAQITVGLSHNRMKWEVNAEQSAYTVTDLDPAVLRRDLALMVAHYQNDTPQQLPLGKYDIVFGPAATADLLTYLHGGGLDGGEMKRGNSFLSEKDAGKGVFSPLFTLVDDPARPQTFPFRRDFTGISRQSYPLIEKGVFQGFIWAQDDADEFGARVTGHTVSHISLVLKSGNKETGTLDEFLSMPRDADILYIPFLHYMGLVNPTKGIVTGSSRFGALLLKKDGSIVVPYNVRLTQSLLDIFGEKVAWLSQAALPYNISRSYGPRNPSAIIVPRFIRVNGLEISHSNPSY